ncbi:MAG: fasciclin domain-containing protein, partial [Bacteroides sp.]|nr:fasciclin domain-containing protein [Bacteroides sp.]
QSLSADSSLFISWIDRNRNRYVFSSYDRANEKMTGIPRNQLTKAILNQVGISLPRGSANKEFIENLAGNYIVINNQDNTVTGGLPNRWGYNGDSVVEIHPILLEEESDNGRTYDVTGWFSMPISDMYSRITSHPHFFNLIDQAGLFDNVYYTFPFLTEGETYTVFVPTEEALSNYNTDTLTNSELQAFIKYHFLRGAKIWTDGSSSSGYYETLRVDESSTQYTKKYSSLNIETGIDLIRILDKDGNLYTEIQEKEGDTNLMIATDMDEASNSNYDFVTTGVLHEIDKVLIKQ